MSTNIEWVRNPDGSKGKTWPVVTGCTPVSEGCRNCFAARMAATRLKHHPRYEGLATIENGKARWTGKVNFNRDVLEQPLRWRKPRMVFVASMGDLFHHDVSFEFALSVWRIMWQAKQHSFQVLTKRPDRMLNFLEHLAGDTRNGKPQLFKTVKVAGNLRLSPLPNVWLGVSVENQAAADERIPLLLRTPAAVRFVSVEPMLEPIQFYDRAQRCATLCVRYAAGAPAKCPIGRCYAAEGKIPKGITWVICGGESGPGARPMHPDWARSLRDQCQAAGTPYFFKQWGAWLPLSQRTDQQQVTCAREAKVRLVPGGASIQYEYCYRVGKKRAGHLLDGRAWQEFPRISSKGTIE